jgi:hypothetical protein
MIVLQTESTTGDEKGKEIAEAINMKINEYMVNFMFLQHRDEPDRAYVDCSVKEEVDDRLKKAETLGYVSRAIMKDVYLKEGATISVKADKEIELSTPDDTTGVLLFQFSADVKSPSEIYLGPTEAAAALSKKRYRGFVIFKAALKDAGPTERRLRWKDVDASVQVILCSMPVSLQVGDGLINMNM